MKQAALRASSAGAEHGRSNRGLRQYFNEDWSPRRDVHAFMSEIARLAVHRNISQEELANRFNEIAGTHHTGGNVNRHFDSKTLRRKVIDTYARIFSLPDAYVDLLLASERGKPYYNLGDWPGADLKGFLEWRLMPQVVEPLFRVGAIARALDLLERNETFAVQCVNEAELCSYRHMLFGLTLPDTLGPRIARRSLEGDRREYDWAVEIRHSSLDPSFTEEPENTAMLVVKWAIVAERIREKYAFDLVGEKRPWATERSEELLLARVFEVLYGRLNEFEWLALQAQLEAIFIRKGLSVEAMRARLRSEVLFSDTDWEDGLYWERVHAEAQASDIF